jgi:hypothetical protein
MVVLTEHICTWTHWLNLHLTPGRNCVTARVEGLSRKRPPPGREMVTIYALSVSGKFFQIIRTFCTVSPFLYSWSKYTAIFLDYERMPQSANECNDIAKQQACMWGNHLHGSPGEAAVRYWTIGIIPEDEATRPVGEAPGWLLATGRSNGRMRYLSGRCPAYALQHRSPTAYLLLVAICGRRVSHLSFAT